MRRERYQIRYNFNRLCYTTPMIIGARELTLHLPECHSLKDKRQVVKSLLARVRNQFEVAIAEVDENDLWQIAKIGICCVSNENQHAEQILQRVQHFIEETRPDVLISNTETELIRW